MRKALLFLCLLLCTSRSFAEPISSPTGYVNDFYSSVFWSLFTAEVTDEAYGRITGYGPITENAPETKGFHPDYTDYADYYELAYKTQHHWIYIWKIKWDVIPPGAIAP